MSGSIRARIGRVLAGAGLLSALAMPAMAVGSPDGSAAQHRAPATVVDGIAFDYLPDGLGRSSDFHYDYAGVDFVSRVWESSTPQGWSVDLDVIVMRGAHMRTKATFRRWFVAYEQRAPVPTYIPFGVHRHYGWLAKDQSFWLLRPGLAVSVQLDHGRWPSHDVVRTAWSAHR
jgi:hypothetical protein